MLTILTHDNRYSDDEHDGLLETDYKIMGKIRSGGFGEVFKGRRCCDNAAIAFKVIKKEKIKRWTTVKE